MKKLKPALLAAVPAALVAGSALAMPCPSILTQYGVGYSWADRYCMIRSVSDQTEKPDFLKCLALQKEGDEQGERALNGCLTPETTAATIRVLESPDYRACLGALEKAGIKSSRPSLCRDHLAQHPGRFDAESFGKCVGFGVRSGVRNYWERLEAASLSSNRAKTYPAPATAAILRDCGKSFPAGTRIAGGAIFLGELSYATGTQIGDGYRTAEFGGVSGVDYDPETKTLRMVSDDKGRPRIFVATLEMNPKTGAAVISHREPIFISTFGQEGKYHDNEDLVRLPNGNLLVSSEMDQNGLFVMAEESERQGSRASLLREITPSGFDAGAWKMPAAYRSERKGEASVERRQVWIPDPATTTSRAAPTEERPKKKEKTEERDSFFPSLSGIFSKRDARGEPVSEERSGYRYEAPKGHYEWKEFPVTKYSLVSGIAPNAGFEALGISPDGKTVFFANEMPMIQDLKGGKTSPIRLTVMDAKSGAEPRATYRYPLENKEDNGLVAIAAISSTRFLALERAFDRRTKIVSSRIYRVDLADAPSGAKLGARKKLVMDLDSILGDLPPGYRRIDNYEGMTFGPRLADGRRTVILVSDNNFNVQQRTSLLFLALPAEI